MSMKETAGLAWEIVPGGGAALTADNPDRIKKARRSWLSISVAHKVEQCPAKHLGESNLPRMFDPFSAAELGTGAHSVMEDFYSLPPQERTEEALRAISATVADNFWDPNKLADQNAETVAANQLNRGYWHSIVLDYSLGIFQTENPAEVDVLGLEWSFKGKELSNGLVTVGAIDRTRRMPDGTVGVDDMKFGKWREPNLRFRDNYGMQGRLYKDVYETATSEPVSSVRLIYPRAAHIRDIDITPELVKSTVDSVAETGNDLSTYVEDGRFPAKPSALCGWCELSRSCPVARLQKDNARDNASKMRSPVELGIPGSRPDEEDLISRRARVLAEAKAERDQAMAASQQQVSELAGTAHTNSSTNTGGNMSHVQAPQPQQPAASQMPQAPQQAAVAPQVPQAPTMRPRRPETYVKSAIVGDVLDLGSYAARNASTISQFAVYLMREGGQPVNPNNLNLLARQIGRIVRRAEFEFTGNTDLQMGAGSLALYAVREAIQYLPHSSTPGAVPFGQTSDAWGVWAKRVTIIAVTIMQTTDAVFADDSIEFDLDTELANTFTPHAQQPYAG